MALLRIDAFEYDIELAVFDKDGTLIDYALMWNNQADQATKAMLDAAPSSLDRAEVHKRVLAAIGLDPHSGESDPDGPLAAGPNELVYAKATEVLVQQGLEDATSLVEKHFIPAFRAHPPHHVIRLVADVETLFRRLGQRGVPVIVATADYRDTTIRTMQELGLAELVTDYVCVDDVQHPVKHDPDALLHQGRRFAVSPEKIMMAGDTISDLRMARAAGIGLGLGVLTGAADRAALFPWSDLVVDSVDAIDVV